MPRWATSPTCTTRTAAGCLDPDNGAFHDANYGWLYDAATGHLVDEATGKHYDMSYASVEE